MQEQLAKPLILAIDDEHSALADVMEALGPPAYECRTCRDPGRAVALAKELSPDLIVCDINIAGQSGLELCESIKNEPELSAIPVVFLSGAEIPDVVRQAHAAGGAYYLRKPFDPGVLQDLVDRALWMPHLVAGRLG